MKIMKDNEIALVKEILKKLGASEEDCELVAEATIDADLKGFTSHGLGRFPQYLISIESGTINLKDNITIEKETPAIALLQASSELRRMTKKAWKMIDIVLQIPLNNEDPDKSVLKKLDEREKQVDDMQGEITEYLSLLMHNQQLTTRQAEQIPDLLHCTNDAERIGDHTSIIRKLLKEFKDEEGKLSGEAIDEFKTLYEVLAEQAQCTISLLDSYSLEKQNTADKLRDRMVDLTAKYEKNHLKRVRNSKCMGASGVFFLEMLSEFRKISRHFGNVTDRAQNLCK